VCFFEALTDIWPRESVLFGPGLIFAPESGTLKCKAWFVVSFWTILYQVRIFDAVIAPQT
jgi:hypothetical protein